MTDEHGPDAPEQTDYRQYLPTLADLIDRLSIVTLKEIYLPENREAYRVEREMLKHDISLLLSQQIAMTDPAEFIRACMICMLANRVIWESESKARAGGNEQDKLLKFSHSVNGIRNTAKNVIARATGGRVDLKIDALAADLPPEFGSWGIF